MVIGDWSSENTQSKKIQNTQKVDFPVADPVDRLAAQIIDFVVVIFPLFALMSAPLKRSFMESFLISEWPQMISVAVEMALIFLLTFILTQTICAGFFGKTLGKKLLGLEVKDIWSGKQPSLWQSFLRSVFSFFQIIFFGLPFLLVLTNRKHRGVHDQLCETMVVQINGEGARPLVLWPIKVFMRSSFILVIAIVIPGMLKTLSTSLEFIDLSAIFESQSNHSKSCEKASNLDEAMAMVASGYLEPHCLKAYTDLEFVDGANPSSLAYLAKSFQLVENSELSDYYLDQVCITDTESAACVLSKFISEWSDENIPEVERILEQASKYQDPFLKLWALRYYQQAGLYQKSLDFSKDLVQDEKYGIYVKTQRLKAKYFVGEVSESDEELTLMSLQSNSPVVIDTMAWSCLKKIGSSCENIDHPFCQKVKASSAGENSFQTRLLLGKMRVSECEGEKLSGEEFVSSAQPLAWQEFNFALKKESKGDLKSAWVLFENLIKKSDTPDYLKSEAIRRMSLHPELFEVKNLNELVYEIETFEHRQESAVVVAAVFQKLNLTELAQNLLEDHNLKGPSSPSRIPASRLEEK